MIEGFHPGSVGVFTLDGGQSLIRALFSSPSRYIVMQTSRTGDLNCGRIGELPEGTPVFWTERMRKDNHPSRR